MAFWGVKVKPGKVTPFVPPPESSKLHLSQASLSAAAPAGAKAALHVKVGDGEPLVICVLREGGAESLGLDLIFDAYTEFTVEGGAAVDLTGYYMPEYELDDAQDYDSEDDDDEDPRALIASRGGNQILNYGEYGVPLLAGDYNSDDDSDYECEEEEEDDDLMLGSDDEYGSEDEEGESEDEEGLRQLGRGRQVVIEEIHDEEPEAAADKEKDGQATAAAGQAIANGKAGQFEDDDVEASDEEGEEEEEGSEDKEEGLEGEEGESEEESEESDEKEEEEQAPAPQRAGQKRKSEAAAAPAKRQAVQQQGQQRGKPGAAAVWATPAAAAKTPQQTQQAKQQLQQQPKLEKAAKQQKQQQQQQEGKAPAKAPAKTPIKGEEAVAANEMPSSNKKVRRFANGFELEELKRGRPDGKLAKPGKKVVVQYVGRLKSNGKIFDQTKGNNTFTFRLGVGEVIKGWDAGINGMRVGDKRKLTIPPQMAYGTSGVRNSIPPNAWLIFDVELVDVKG